MLLLGDQSVSCRLEGAWEPGCGSALGRGISEFQIPGTSRLTSKLMKPSQNKIQSAGIVAQYLTGMREAPGFSPSEGLGTGGRDTVVRCQKLLEFELFMECVEDT